MIESAPAASPSAALWLGLPYLRLARKGVLALGIKLVGAGLAFTLQVTLARVLGQSGYGQYAYVFAWLQVMLIFAQGGFSTAALRYVAEYRARQQPELVRGFLRRSTQIVLIESVLLALFMAGCAIALSRSGSVGTVRSFLIASAALPVLAQFLLFAEVVRGLGHVLSSMLVSLAHPALLLLALLATAFLFRFQVSPAEALVLNLGAAICALGLAAALQRQVQRDLTQDSQHAYRTSEWMSTSMQMTAIVGLTYLQGRTGVIVSGLLLDAQRAGTYAAIERVSDVALLGLTSVNMLAAPRFAALHAQGRLVDLQRYARLAALGASGFMFATVVPLVLFGKQILCVFGDEFASGYPALVVLLAGVAVNALCGSVGYLLNMTGYQRDTAKIACSSLCLNLILSAALIPKYGIIGTSIAFAISMAWWNVVMLLVVRRRLGIWACLGPIR